MGLLCLLAVRWLVNVQVQKRRPNRETTIDSIPLIWRLSFCVYNNLFSLALNAQKRAERRCKHRVNVQKNVAVYAAVPLYWHWLILHQSYATTKSCAQSSNDRLEMYCDFIWSKSIASHLWNAQLALTREGFVWKEESRSISWLRVKSKLDSQVSLPCTSALATFAIESQTNA